jgi:hypothetical protein
LQLRRMGRNSRRERAASAVTGDVCPVPRRPMRAVEQMWLLHCRVIITSRKACEGLGR